MRALAPARHLPRDLSRGRRAAGDRGGSHDLDLVAGCGAVPRAASGKFAGCSRRPVPSPRPCPQATGEGRGAPGVRGRTRGSRWPTIAHSVLHHAARCALWYKMDSGGGNAAWAPTAHRRAALPSPPGKCQHPRVGTRAALPRLPEVPGFSPR